jgi:hypothetical protein
MLHKKNFEENVSFEEKERAEQATIELLEAFTPLFKKYLLLIKSTNVDFEDKEMKRFVLSFIGDPELKAALKRSRQSKEKRHEIMEHFGFVQTTYGQQSNDEIMTDLQMLLLILAKRYKQMGRNFCAYCYNVYSYEVSRYIKKYIANTGNISYKILPYEDCINYTPDKCIHDDLLDKTYEDNTGIPDSSWIQGLTCSNEFLDLDSLDRKIIIKYYLENYTDGEVAEELGLHINTCNKRRKKALAKLATIFDVDLKKIPRNRNSGKNRNGLYWNKKKKRS